MGQSRPGVEHLEAQLSNVTIWTQALKPINQSTFAVPLRGFLVNFMGIPAWVGSTPKFRRVSMDFVFASGRLFSAPNHSKIPTRPCCRPNSNPRPASMLPDAYCVADALRRDLAVE